jgi:acetyl esterase/lipase
MPQPTDRRSTWQFLSVATLSCLAGCGDTNGASGDTDFFSDIAPDVVLEDRYPERANSFPGGVTALADVVYSVVPGFRPMILDLYLPAAAVKPATGYPVIVYIHGGGWIGGHTRHSGAFANWPKTLASIAANGYVVASVEYRLSGEAPFPAALEDVQNSIRWLRQNADRFSIDKDRFLTWGGSAGGQLAALAATACGDNPLKLTDVDSTDEAGKPAAESPCVQGAMIWYGVFDFGGLVPTIAAESPQTTLPTVLSQYLDCRDGFCNAETVAAASPLHHLDSADPPMLLIHGDGDQVVLVNQSEKMYEALQDADVESELIVIPDVGHSFVGATPEVTAEASQLAFDASMSFAQRTLGRGNEE